MFATVFRSAFSKRSSEGIEFEESLASSSEESSTMRRRGIVSRVVVESRAVYLVAAWLRIAARQLQFTE